MFLTLYYANNQLFTYWCVEKGWMLLSKKEDEGNGGLTQKNIRNVFFAWFFCVCIFGSV